MRLGKIGREREEKEKKEKEERERERILSVEGLEEKRYSLYHSRFNSWIYEIN